MDESEDKMGTNTSGSKFAVVDLFEWKSQDRPAWTFSIETFRTLGAIALLISIIMLFFQEWLAIVVTWSAFFLFYALTKVPPMMVAHKITNQGIVSMDKSYIWNELGPFWFSEKPDGVTLHVATRNVFGQLILIIDKEDKEKIRDILAEYLPYVEKLEKSQVDKLQEWFSKTFPIEKMVKKDFGVQAKPETDDKPPTFSHEALTERPGDSPHTT